MPPPEEDEPLPFDVGDWIPPKPRLRRDPTGEAHHRARLTWAKVREMRRLRVEDPDRWTYAALALRFGCCIATANNICRSLIWRHDPAFS